MREESGPWQASQAPLTVFTYPNNKPTVVVVQKRAEWWNGCPEAHQGKNIPEIPTSPRCVLN